MAYQRYVDSSKSVAQIQLGLRSAFIVQVKPHIIWNKSRKNVNNINNLFLVFVIHSYVVSPVS